MASIGPVELQIFMNNPSQGQALAQVGYTISATGVDVADGRNYRELVELVRVGGIGEPGVEHLVPDGTMWDAPFMFTDNTVGFTHTRELSCRSPPWSRAASLRWNPTPSAHGSRWRHFPRRRRLERATP
jgi:hypothetical protein